MKTFVALYMGEPGKGSDISPDTLAKGMAGWKAWMAQHAAEIVEAGGPLGVTKKISAQGIEDIRNRVAAYVVVRADSHEAAARMFLNHPHFSIFPGDSVEVMERLPIPGS